MSGAGILACAADGDSYASNLAALLHFDGSDIVDAKGHTVTIVGSAALSATQARFGDKSLFCPGQTDGITVGASADFAMSASSLFTLEFWVYPTVVTDCIPIWLNDPGSSGGGGLYLSFTGARKISSYCLGGGAVTTANSFTLNAWNHVAAIKGANRFAVGINGVLTSATGLFPGTPASSWRLDINRHPVFAGMTGCYYDEIAFYQGIEKYTGSTYTVPSSPFGNA